MGRRTQTSSATGLCDPTHRSADDPRVQGPTQTAEWGAADQWRPHPAISRMLRGAIFVAPLAISFGFSWWASQAFPHDELGLHIVVWWIGVSILATITLILSDKIARRLLPLAALLKLSLAFPDEAPSRFRTALRSNTTKQLAREVEHHRTHGRFSDNMSHAEYLLSLAKAIGAHDRLTRGHSERVRAYSTMIADEMGLPERDRSRLQWAALLHDVGKLDVPSEILNKSEMPDDDEWAVLQTHPEAAVAYLEPLKPWLGEWVAAADEHHLRWDGKGYPKTTAGTDISLAGRIVAVADAYDTMTSVRSYKEAMSAEDARAEIAACAGTQFDPAVTRAFLNAGLGRRRVVAGPLSWLGHTFGLDVAVPFTTVASPAATIAAPVSAAASSATRVAVGVAASVSGASLVAEVPPPPPPPPAVAFAEAPATTTTTTTTTTTSVPTTTEAPTTTADSLVGALVGDLDGLEATTTTAPTTTTTAAPTTTTTAAPTTTTAAPTTTTTAPATGPTAADDSRSIESGHGRRIMVLANDQPGSEPFDLATLRIVTPPQYAESYRVQDDHLRYRADDNYVGPDSMEYEICNQAGLCDRATVSITVFED